MRRKRRSDSSERQVMSMVGSGLALGIGSQALGEIGGDSATYAQQGLGRVAKFMPAAGTMVGAGMTLKAMRRLR